MKAWILRDRSGYCEYESLVFAETIGQAKKQANYSNGYMYSPDLEIEEWINISANRAKLFDGMENASEKEICIKLIEDGWWFEVGNKKYDESNIDEFKALWK